ncbi:cysteine hydrolase [Siccirubricoccus sp. KC 17139]|uniref:Cysteine hydrolase n=1 Tax=Siccirubricoccus soli TaxID=2899147 RepID=A0ABT1DBV8_9PROT|nr:isochorismatase family cysteine hydrolase [Siccirubricoccus soli]MCO6419421.1 cysteine hydrolase [Siccirubricoccus soli]MCP2685556.1 cysteine hydrolase [Siccirubricoccus soli]
MSDGGLQHGPLGESCLHLCVDMQRLFAEDTEWHTPWMARVLPVVTRLAEAHAAQTIFTRFIPASRAEECGGTWRRYYTRWASMTLEALPPGMIDLVAPLARLVPPAEIFDKRVYSPWSDGELHRRLRRRGIDTLVISGAETDVCVLAAVLGAVDLGYRIIVPTDAICSSSDRAHDALLTLYHERFGQQVEAARVEEILAAWR